MRDETHHPDTDETLREQLSAMLDDELEADATRFLLSRLQHDRRLSNTLDRYQLIQQCLRQESLDMLGDQRLRTRVRVALESTQQEKARFTARTGWSRPLGGVAVAASVALMAIFGLEHLRQSGGPTEFSAPTVAGVQTLPQAADQPPALNTVNMPLEGQVASIQPVAHTQVLPARLSQYLRGPGVKQVVEGQQPVRYIYLVRPNPVQDTSGAARQP